ncbi:MAG: hypothetical protein AD742_01740 [Methylibium sp. NZG]|nr:MAG: hypothetical protein AD742_01740 [Methylibium sp. NZG]
MALTFQTKLPRDIPKSARVYSLPAPKVSATQLKSIARGFGLGSAEFDLLTSSDRMGLHGGRWQIDVQRASGALQAVNVDRYGIDTGQAFELSDRRAQGVAAKFLSQSKLVPMASARALKVTHLRSADADVKGESLTERLLDAGVVYGRVVDGLPVTGPGGLAMVHIDAAGAVVGVRSTWRALGKSAGTVKIKPIDWAVEGLEKEVAGMIGKVAVLKAQFGYFELGALDRQSVLEPVYAFVYAVHNEGVSSKHVHVVHAGDKAYGRLMGRRRFPAAAQKARRG